MYPRSGPYIAFGDTDPLLGYILDPLANLFQIVTESPKNLVKHGYLVMVVFTPLRQHFL